MFGLIEYIEKKRPEAILVIPDNKTLDSFTETINPVMEKMKISKKEKVRIMEARDRLLPKLMSGEIEL